MSRMSTVSETLLPGLGVRFEFETKSRHPPGRAAAAGGRIELLVYDPSDPDTVIESISLDDEEARTLAELLGSSRVVEDLGRLRQRIEGLAIDWLPLGRVPLRGRTIGDTEARTRTGGPSWRWCAARTRSRLLDPSRGWMPVTPWSSSVRRGASKTSP